MKQIETTNLQLSAYLMTQGATLKDTIHADRKVLFVLESVKDLTKPLSEYAAGKAKCLILDYDRNLSILRDRIRLAGVRG